MTAADGAILGEPIAVAAERLGDRAGAVLGRLAGAAADARAAFDELAALDPAARRRRRAEWMARARTPVPPGLRGVHPSWIEAGLAALPPRAREAVATGPSDPFDVWLARWACAELVEMPATRVQRRPPGSVVDALALGAAELDAWLTSIGCDQLAFAISHAGGDARSLAIRRHGSALQRAFDRIESRPRAGQLGTARAAIARCHVAADDTLALARIGARALAPHLASRPYAARQLALRLPRTVGQPLLVELVDEAGAPLDQAPSWDALAAE